jgi:hypothetical protein
VNTPTVSFSDYFESLPGGDSKLFKSIWGEKRLLFRKRESPDRCDEMSARLITAATVQKKSIFLVLPDDKANRAAFLLATVLLTLWWRNHLNSRRIRKSSVLYFGSHIGIREQLRNTSIGGWTLDLASVFGQTQLGRRLNTRTGETVDVENSALPQVVTAYSPIDPVAIIRDRAPDLVAVDLAEASQSDWFEQVVAHTSEKKIPLITWGTNPLSACVSQFRDRHQVFVWPASEFFNPTAYPLSPTIRSLRAILLTGEIVDEIEPPFRRVYGLLLRASKAATTPLEHRAIAVHWNYLRALEAMNVPCELYETEAPRFWGLRPIQSIREAGEKFRDNVQPSIASELEQATGLMDQVYKTICKEPPIWSALSNLCVDPKSDVKRVITFTGRARKQLFLLALLAHYNITEDDLQRGGTEIQSLDQFPRLQESSALKIEAIMSNLPSPLLVPKLLPFLTAGASRILVLPHQMAALNRRFESSRQMLSSTVGELFKTFHELGTPNSQTQPNNADGLSFPQVIKLDGSICFKIDTRASDSAATVRSHRAVLRENTAVDELTRLFESETIENSLDAQADVGGFEPEITEGTHDTGNSDFVPNAIAVTFSEGFRALFPSDYVVQVITTVNARQELRESVVVSLKSLDRIVYMQGQRRQNLYDLIVSRVHKHVAFQVHLSLIRRWQDDLRLAYLAQVPHLSVDEILARLRTLGSDIKWPITIRSWINGERLCPDDPEDLNRIAQLMDLKFVASQYRRIHKAAIRIRGIHIGLALRLNSWLERACADSESDDEIFDQELGLTFGDFRHSLVVLTVVSLEAFQGPFLRSALGQLEKI